MSIQLHTNYAFGNYADTLFAILKQLEGIKWQPYLDSKKIPTIGVGFNLTDSSVFDKVATTLGIDPNASVSERNYYNQIFAAARQPYSTVEDLLFALNSIMLDRYADITDMAVNKQPAFEFDISSDAQIQLAFNKIIPAYEDRVTSWLTANGIAGIGESNERVALVSLAYNSPTDKITGYPNLLGPALGKALAAGDRAEAWYEIRYDSNGGTSPSSGIANRRYKESELFGLYNDANNVTEDDAKNAYRMFTRHKTVIMGPDGEDGGAPGYEDTYPVANANIALPGLLTAYTLQTELTQARQLLLSKYSYGVDIAWNHIQVGEDSTSFVVAKHYDDSDRLIGTQYNDLILGESGDDYIDGNGGNDVMYGGAGDDFYIVDGQNSNSTRIEDKEGVNTVVLNDVALKFFVKDNGQTGFYKTPDKRFTGVRDPATGDFTVTDTQVGNAVILNADFQDGDFGIRLIDQTQPATTHDILGGYGYKDFDTRIDTGTLIGTQVVDVNGVSTEVPIYQPLYPDGSTGVRYEVDPYTTGSGSTSFGAYTYLGNYSIDLNLPLVGRAGTLDTLFGGAGNDHITGGGGADQIYGQAGDDFIEAGINNPDQNTIDWDYVEGGDGNDVIVGGVGTDVLVGGAGNDQLYARFESDLATLATDAATPNANRDWLDGGDGNDFLVGSAGDNGLCGGGGNDVILGGAGDDSIMGDTDYVARFIADPGQVISSNHWVAFPDFKWTYTDNDNVRAFSYVEENPNAAPGGDDVLYGGDGNDWMEGSANSSGRDIFFGGAGNDTLYGKQGDDLMSLAA
jgi:Ca2+-binding RTX toxin-like protein